MGIAGRTSEKVASERRNEGKPEGSRARRETLTNEGGKGSRKMFCPYTSLPMAISIPGRAPSGASLIDDLTLERIRDRSKISLVVIALIVRLRAIFLLVINACRRVRVTRLADTRLQVACRVALMPPS